MSQEQMEQKILARAVARTNTQIEEARKIYAANFANTDNAVLLAAIITALAQNHTHLHARSGL